MGKRKCKDHLGNEFPSITAMCKHYGISADVFYGRKNMGWDLEKILTYSEEDREASYGKSCTDHLGNQFSSIQKMCEHWGIAYDNYYSWKAKGCTLKEILTQGETTKKATAKPCVDHLGNKFPSIAAMCDYYGVDTSTFDYRKNRGLSLEQCLTFSKNKACVDHLGNEYLSTAEMCAHWGVKYSTYCVRKQKGRSLEECLTGVGAVERLGSAKKCKDHLGNEFTSMRAMCKYWGVNACTFRDRKKKGWDLERCLTYDYAENHNNTGVCCKDHLGNEFPTVRKMCEHWGVTICSFYSRKNKGWDLERCLTYTNTDTFCVDHLGDEYLSEKEMCAYWGVRYETYCYRKRKGWSLEECLTGNTKECKDHLGNEFPTIKKMCEHWRVNVYTFHFRKRKGWDLEKCLTHRNTEESFSVNTSSTDDIDNTHAKRKNIACTDHLGQEFKSHTAMFKHWGINRRTFSSRISRGWTLEKALTEPVVKTKKHK